MPSAKYSLALIALAATGCVPFTGPDCIDETRGLSVHATLTSMLAQPLPGDTGRAHLSLLEARNHDSKRTTYQNIGWFVGSGLVRSRVTAVHVHDSANGRIVLNIPIDTTHGPPFVVTQTLQVQPYSGEMRWNDFYHLLGNGGAHVDVHTIDAPGGQLRGTLKPEYPNWREFNHAYCS